MSEEQYQEMRQFVADWHGVELKDVKKSDVQREMQQFAWNENIFKGMLE